MFTTAEELVSMVEEQAEDKEWLLDVALGEDWGRVETPGRGRLF